MPYPWSAGNVLTATDLNSALAAKYDNAPAINAQVGTTYTFVLADATAGKTITASNASASTYTVPPQSSVAFSAGALLRVTNLGAGVVTFAGGIGVTVTNTAVTLAQYQSATLVRTASDAWTVIAAGSAGGLVLLATATASAASAVSINNCFSSAYDNYRIVMQLSSFGAYVWMRMRAGGADNTSANYYYGGAMAVSSSDSTYNSIRSAGAATAWRVGSSAVVSNQAIVLDISGPNQSYRTGLLLNSIGVGATDMDWTTLGGNMSVTTAYDGFTIYPNTGTITTPTNGIRVYGYKNT